MSSSFNFKNVIFPHFSEKKQKKQVSFMYCFHINIPDYRSYNDKDFQSYLDDMYKFVNLNMQNNLISPEQDSKKYNQVLYKALTRPENGNSSTFSIKFSDPREKREVDEFLLRTNWKRKLDKFASIYEGCQNEDKLFIGGKKDLIIYYCGLFPNVDFCKNLKKKTSLDLIDNKMKRVFDNPDLADMVFEEMFKSLDLIDDNNMNSKREF